MRLRTGFYDHASRSNAEACQKTATLVLCALEQVRILSSTNGRRKDHTRLHAVVNAEEEKKQFKWSTVPTRGCE